MILVCIHAVGPHPADEVVDFPEDAGIDVERLLALGAVRHASDEEAVDACPYGESRRYMLQAIPQVLTARERLILGDGEKPAEGQPHAEIDTSPIEATVSDNVTTKRKAATKTPAK